jgi:hypothetical protein
MLLPAFEAEPVLDRCGWGGTMIARYYNPATNSGMALNFTHRAFAGSRANVK